MAKQHWLAPPEWWIKVKPLRWAAAGGIVFAIVSATYTAKVLIGPGQHDEAARFIEGAADTVKLLDGFRSYDTVESVKAQFETAQQVYSQTSVHPPASRKYPPRDRDTVAVAAYKHHGVEGPLTLEFFNDRLYEASFIPADAEVYAARLHAADRRLARERSGRVEQITGNLRIASNVDFSITDVGRSLQTKPYVVWQDLRLVQLLDEWDRRFVALPQANQN